jgi:uncharacterized membrane protein affecting hemolysin expression
LALTILLLISIIVQALSWVKINKLKTNYQRLTQGIDNKNLEELILVVNEQVAHDSGKLLEIERLQKELHEQLNNCMKSPKIVRYNAFDNMGSNLSFSLSLLDKQNNGVVITSIYGRDESRFYAKKISSGKAEQPLSPEEKEVIQ